MKLPQGNKKMKNRPFLATGILFAFAFTNSCIKKHQIKLKAFLI
jgi:hypothetical protein